MNLILELNLRLRTFKHEFEDWDYFEKYKNNKIVDTYFAKKGTTFPDGTLKNNAVKYFYSREQGDAIVKEVTHLRHLDKFSFFDKLYCLVDGEVVRVDGTPASECVYKL